MANEIRKPVRYLQGIACTLGLEGDDPGLTRLAEELSAALNLKELDAIEDVLCRGEIPWWDVVNVAAGGAGFRSICQVINDSTDHLVIVDGACTSLANAAGLTVNWSRTATVLTNDRGLVAARDGRYSRGTVPFTRLRDQNGVALPAGVSTGQSWEEDTPNNVGVRLPCKVVLPPGQSLATYPGVDNIAIRANFFGRTWRVSTQRELNP